MTDAAQLLAMLEGAKRPEREFDGPLHHLFFPLDDRSLITNHIGVAGERNAYSKSLEAAIMLAEGWLVRREEQLEEEWEYRVHRTSPGSFCGVVWQPSNIEHEYFGIHGYPSMALLIALTRAVAQAESRSTPPVDGSGSGRVEP